MNAIIKMIYGNLRIITDNSRIAVGIYKLSHQY